MDVTVSKHFFYTYEAHIGFDDFKYKFRIKKDGFGLSIYRVTKGGNVTPEGELDFARFGILKYIDERLYKEAEKVLDKAQQDDCETYDKEGSEEIKL